MHLSVEVTRVFRPSFQALLKKLMLHHLEFQALFLRAYLSASSIYHVEQILLFLPQCVTEVELNRDRPQDLDSHEGHWAEVSLVKRL